MTRTEKIKLAAQKSEQLELINQGLKNLRKIATKTVSSDDEEAYDILRVGIDALTQVQPGDNVPIDIVSQPIPNGPKTLYKRDGFSIMFSDKSNFAKVLDIVKDEMTRVKKKLQKEIDELVPEKK